MNVIIPPKRRDGGTSFMKLVGYLSLRDEKKPDDVITPDKTSKTSSRSSQAIFDRLVDYVERRNDFSPMQVVASFPDGREQVIVGGVECETNCFSLETAAAEMNMVSAQNRHCKDPVYHFILSWQEDEAPTPSQVFDSARHCLEKLGMANHQFVTAIHRDTDNIHCHIAVNRVNPETYRAANLWNDADTLQQCCRVLEKRFGFKQDNGSWVWGDNNTLRRAPWRFRNAPQGAAKREIFSDKESLYHYAVRQVRSKITDAIKNKTASWNYFHLLMHANGLGLREQSGGLVIYDIARPDTMMVKASDVHPSLSKTRLEPYFGQFEAPPSFNSEDLEEGGYAIYNHYQPEFQVRDREARKERREERAAARDDLKLRYKKYRDTWVKPDLNVRARYQELAAHYQAMKGNVRHSYRDPLLRKLMYRVAEFERMKATAELRIQIREERKTLFESGQYRPLSYRSWVEREALTGDVAAISQLRGWAYREKRKAKVAEPNKHKDSVLVFGVADDSPLLERSTHATRLHRNGTVEYLRDGVVGVVDRGSQVEIKPGFDDYDDTANYHLAAEIAGTKSGERVEVVGTDDFVDRVLVEGCRLNYQQEKEVFRPTDNWQRGRSEVLEHRHVRPEMGYDAPAGSRQADERDDDAPTVNSYWGPRP
ncbi:relaxase (plasmid) [Serratia marcescens]|nr:relaxase [Serratia marcescens]